MQSRSELTDLLKSDEPNRRLEAMTDLCNMVEKHHSLMGAIDLILVPVFDALEQEKERKIFVLGCKAIADSPIPWNFGPGSMLLEYCRKSLKSMEAFATVLSFLQDRYPVQEHFKFKLLFPDLFGDAGEAVDTTCENSDFEMLWFEVLSLSIRESNPIYGEKEIVSKYELFNFEFNPNSTFLDPWNDLLEIVPVRSASLMRKFWNIRNYAVQKGPLDQEKVKTLAVDPHRSTRFRLALNSNCPDQLRRKILSEVSTINRNGTSQELNDVWYRTTPKRPHWIPTASDSSFITWEDEEEVRTAINGHLKNFQMSACPSPLGHQRSKPEQKEKEKDTTLSEFMATEVVDLQMDWQNAKKRWHLIRKNGDKNSGLFARLARKRDPRIRCAVARDPECPYTILRDFLNDPDESVRAIAEERFKKS